LRSPLTALRLQLQLLDSAPDHAARVEARGRLGAAVERAIHLAEQLLTLARTDPRETAGEFAAVDLSVCAAQGITDTHDLALARDIDLGLDAAPNLMVKGDAEALRILVRNLVDNAVRYSPPQGAVQVRCRNTDAGAVLEVIDAGPGIAPADRERVFDRFYRRAAAQESGTGLGLAIVKAIAERHGAQVVLDDAPGGGLRVAVSCPRPS
jgi:signal transduction histidine kinase